MIHRAAQRRTMPASKQPVTPAKQTKRVRNYFGRKGLTFLCGNVLFTQNSRMSAFVLLLNWREIHPTKAVAWQRAMPIGKMGLNLLENRVDDLSVAGRTKHHRIHAVC
jgi:hypothetical protein